MNKCFKKMFNWTMVLLFLIQVLGSSVITSYAISVTNYEIYTPADLYNVRDDINGNYRLMNDIDISGFGNWTPVPDLNGQLDGQGFSVTGLKYDIPDQGNLGLFGSNHGTIKNLKIIGDIKSESITAKGFYIGLLVGYNYGIVDKCSAQGSVLGSSNVGGLIGCNEGVVTNSSADVTVTGVKGYLGFSLDNSFYVGGFLGRNTVNGRIEKCFASGDVTGDDQVGGFMGNHFQGLLVKNCYATGDVVGVYQVGGFAGRNYSSSNIESVYSTGSVTGTTKVGGLIGEQYNSGTLTNGYYDQTLSGLSDDTGKGKPILHSNMYTQASFVGFDFTTVWTIVDGRTTPYLRGNTPESLPNLINSAPTLNTVINGVEDTVSTGQLTGQDNDNDPITYSLIESTTQGAVTVQSNGLYSYTPNADFYGSDSFTVMLEDTYTTASAVVAIEVSNINDAPTFDALTVTTNEDTTVMGTLIGQDIDSSSLTYSLIEATTNGAVTVESNGAYKYVPNLNFYGNDSFTIKVHDGSTSSSAVIGVVVSPINDAPTIAEVTITTNEDTTAMGTLIGQDVEGSSLSYSLKIEANNGLITVESSGAYKYIPNLNFYGNDSFTIEIHDGTTSSSAVIGVVVSPINDAPIIVDKTIVTTKLATYTGQMTASDVDSTLTYSIVTQPTLGILTIDENTGAIIYKSDETGNTSAVIGVSDGTLSDTALVSIVVNDIYTPPFTVEDNTPPTTTSNVTVSKPDQGTVKMTATGGGTQPLVVSIGSGTIKQWINNDGDGDTGTLAITVEESAAVTSVQLNVDDVQSLKKAGITLEVKTDTATVILPADKIILDDVLDTFGDGVKPEDIKVSINIVEPEETLVDVVKDAASEGKVQIVVPPIEFTITYSYGLQVVEGRLFSGYVEKLVPLPEGVAKSDISTAAVLQADGSLLPVPTTFRTIDGIVYVVIRTRTNSVYTIVYKESNLLDVSGHWAAEEINTLNSRLIVEGDGVYYYPNQAVTRAEFIAIIVRGLGLMDIDHEVSYEDVGPSDWFFANIQSADYYDLIEGSGNEFSPNRTITREETCVILKRAALLIDEQAKGTAISNDFSDVNTVSDWAYESVAFCTENKLILGKNGEMIKPSDSLTRAEAAVLIYRLLALYEFIQ